MPKLLIAIQYLTLNTRLTKFDLSMATNNFLDKFQWNEQCYYRDNSEIQMVISGLLNVPIFWITVQYQMASKVPSKTWNICKPELYSDFLTIHTPDTKKLLFRCFQYSDPRWRRLLVAINNVNLFNSSCLINRINFFSLFLCVNCIIFTIFMLNKNLLNIKFVVQRVNLEPPETCILVKWVVSTILFSIKNDGISIVEFDIRSFLTLNNIVETTKC